MFYSTYSATKILFVAALYIAIDAPAIHVFRIECNGKRPPFLLELVIETLSGQINWEWRWCGPWKGNWGLLLLQEGMNAGEGTHSKCQKNNIMQVSGLFFYCANRKNKQTNLRTSSICSLLTWATERRKLRVLTRFWNWKEIPVKNNYWRWKKSSSS